MPLEFVGDKQWLHLGTVPRVWEELNVGAPVEMSYYLGPLFWDPKLWTLPADFGAAAVWSAWAWKESQQKADEWLGMLKQKDEKRWRRGRRRVQSGSSNFLGSLLVVLQKAGRRVTSKEAASHPEAQSGAIPRQFGNGFDRSNRIEITAKRVGGKRPS